MGKKHITAQRVEGLHGVSVCCVCLSACVCGRWGRYALNSSAERRETQEPVNNSSNSILFLHDCSPALPSSTSEYNSRMWRRTCQKLLVRNKAWPVLFRCVLMFFLCVCVSAHIQTHMHVHIHGFVCLLKTYIDMPLCTLEELSVDLVVSPCPYCPWRDPKVIPV